MGRSLVDLWLIVEIGGGGGGGQPNFCVCPGKKSQNTHTQKLTKIHMEF